MILALILVLRVFFVCFIAAFMHSNKWWWWVPDSWEMLYYLSNGSL